MSPFALTPAGPYEFQVISGSEFILRRIPTSQRRSALSLRASALGGDTPVPAEGTPDTGEAS